MYKDKVKAIKYSRKYSEMHKKEAAIRMRQWGRKTRLALLALLGNKCLKCGFDDFRALQVDHINGGGNKEYKKVATGNNYNRFLLKKILNGSNEYQLLCANCNWIKRYENNEFFK